MAEILPPHTTCLEKFALVALLMQLQQGSWSISLEELKTLLGEYEGMGVVIRMDMTKGILFQVVTPARRAELLAAGWPEY